MIYNPGHLLARLTIIERRREYITIFAFAAILLGCDALMVISIPESLPVVIVLNFMIVGSPFLIIVGTYLFVGFAFILGSPLALLIVIYQHLPRRPQRVLEWIVVSIIVLLAVLTILDFLHDPAAFLNRINEALTDAMDCCPNAHPCGCF